MKCKCGFENTAEAKFCGKCGSPLTEAEPVEPPAPVMVPAATPSSASASAPRKRFFLLGLVIVLVVAAASFGGYWWLHRPQPSNSTSAATATDPTASWNTYTNTLYGYSLKYPPKCIISDSEWGCAATGTSEHVSISLGDEFTFQVVHQTLPDGRPLGDASKLLPSDIYDCFGSIWGASVPQPTTEVNGATAAYKFSGATEGTWHTAGETCYLVTDSAHNDFAISYRWGEAYFLSDLAHPILASMQFTGKGQTQGTMTLSWQLRGSGRYKLDLYGCGDANASGETVEDLTGQGEGQWSSLTARDYYIKITDLGSGQTQQTLPLQVNPSDPGAPVAKLDWNTSHLLTEYDGGRPLAATPEENLELDWWLAGSGRFKVELFGAGDSTPTRQTINNSVPQQIVKDQWTSLPMREYFIRVTNLDTGQAKQTAGFFIDSSRRVAAVVVDMNWNVNFLITDSQGLIIDD